MFLVEIADSILSNRVEIHSMELGIQIALIILLIKYYHSKQMAGNFLGIFLMTFFVFSPSQVVIKKPWYFLSGVVLTLLVYEGILSVKDRLTKRQTGLKPPNPNNREKEGDRTQNLYKRE